MTSPQATESLPDPGELSVYADYGQRAVYNQLLMTGV